MGNPFARSLVVRSNNLVTSARHVGHHGKIAMPRFAANLAIHCNEHGSLDIFAAAAKDGVEAVEFLFPCAFATKDLAERLAGSAGAPRANFSLRAWHREAAHAQACANNASVRPNPVQYLISCRRNSYT